jgi:hypothetical protein
VYSVGLYLKIKKYRIVRRLLFFLWCAKISTKSRQIEQFEQLMVWTQEANALFI